MPAFCAIVSNQEVLNIWIEPIRKTELPAELGRQLIEGSSEPSLS